MIPAAKEIGGAEIHPIRADGDPSEIAGSIAEWAQNDPTLQLKRRVRQGYTWRSIFQRELLPLLDEI